MKDENNKMPTVFPAAQPAPVQEPVANRYCCHSCFKASGGVMLDRMILCSECGNKRCPKASDHNFSCTGSNEPGQGGSIYTTPPAASVQESKRCGLCGEDQPFTGTCGGGRENSKALCYTHAAQRQWVGLTDEDIWNSDAIMSANSGYGANFETLRELHRAIEAKLKEKNSC